MRVLLALLLAMLLVVIGCSSPAPAPPPPAPETANRQPPTATTSGPRVIFTDGFVVGVEIAADNEMRAQGLMFRDHIDSGKGMLFVFPQDDVVSFWMKNTRIPLDMIWIDSGRRVVGIKENVPPCRIEDCPSYGPGVVARYVLEVGGGEAAKHRLKVGDSLQFIDTDVEAR
ncbi:MAG TPA: DUF192 domain-containing protein [Thermoanaerobaculia bacterium]|nr:DUF192 domain-containing protein [Thermoanaerobaculia bacterium]